MVFFISIYEKSLNFSQIISHLFNLFLTPRCQENRKHFEFPQFVQSKLSAYINPKLYLHAFKFPLKVQGGLKYQIFG